MGIKFLFLLSLTAILLISGCTQTGSIINKSGQDEPNFITDPIEAEEDTEYQMENDTENIEYSEEEHVSEKKEDGPKDPCEDIICSDSVTICDDGFRARCKNQCSGGACSICRPDCAGHEIIEPEACELSCGTCEDENLGDCSCAIIVPCDGNGACEEGEYPDSADCPDCNDGRDCTHDLFNFTAESCYQEIIVPCCGNGACENGLGLPENSTSCPEDCVASQQPDETPADGISISFIEQYEEWVEIRNSGTVDENVTGWKLSDAADHVFTFPEFSLPAPSVIFVHTGHGSDNATDLFWNRGSPVWNNNGDNATLKNGAGDVVANYSY